MTKPKQPKRQPEEPRLGIFWLVDDELVIASTPLVQCEPYGDVMNEPRSHVEYWAELQSGGRVPREIEYEEPPRGRVVYSVKTKQYTLIADRCILAKHAIVKRICHELQLPKDTKTDSDLHYRCSACLHKHDHDDE